MAGYNDIIDRVGAAGELPKQLITDIGSDLDVASTVLTLGRKIPTTTRDSRIPVITEAPDAYFVTGDYGKKQTSAATFTNQEIITEEIAVLVVVPDNVIADSEFSIWDALRPLVARAFARRLDKAVLFGDGRPASWPAGVIAQATTAGNMITMTDDPIVDLLAAAGQVSSGGNNPTGAASSPGWQYRAASSRSDAFTGSPVGAGQPFGLAVAGLPVSIDPVYWDAGVADLLVGDWRQLVVGMREDLRFQFSDSGVIVDDAGAVQFSAWQSDSVIMRAVMRVGWTLIEPIGRGDTPEVPFSVVVPESASS